VVMYDLSGLGPNRIKSVMDDWRNLRAEQRITESPAYLWHRGKPLVTVWGVGFSDNRRYTLAECRQLVEFLKNDGCTVMLGVPTYWRELKNDCLKDPALHELLKLSDVVSPWTVGRYKTQPEVTRHEEQQLKPDIAWCRENKLDYLPVVFPGFSWHNMQGGPLNFIPRRKGEFLWSQFTAAKRTGAEMIYVAMFDEVDEGTAIFKCVNNTPDTDNVKFVGYDGLPSDFYLRLTGAGGKLLRGEIPLTDHLPALQWTDIRELGVEGQGWQDTRAPFDRLPARAEATVRPAVWNLSRHSAGMHVRFITDATNIQARWVVTASNLAMPHMAATGVSGLDLYVKTEKGDWHWLAVGKPDRQTNNAALISNLPPGRREYLLYLPLYNGTHSVEIGVPEGASISKAGPWGTGTRKPMLFYGTSILHGACASRPGMVHSAILGRRFQFPHINLGFSGNGKMEPELADLLAELDPSVYVLDCLPNMTAKEVAERVEPFVKKLREAHPQTAIVLVEDRNYADAFLIASKRERNTSSQAALRAAYERLRKAGVKNLHYIKGADLLGDDGEATVDSSHPNDLGFMRQAEAHAKVLGPILKKAAKQP